LLRVLLLPNRAVPADDLPGQGHFVGTAPRAAVGDLEGRAELWHRHSGRKSDLLYEAMRRETDDDARFALKAEHFALWQPFRKIDAKIKRLKRRCQVALDAIRELLPSCGCRSD